MKKIIALLLTLALLLSLSCCVLPAPDQMNTRPSSSSSVPQGSSSSLPETDPTDPSTDPTTQPTAPSTQPTTKPTAPTTKPTQPEQDRLDPEGFYYSKEDVALFIHQYGRLPENYMTKSEAKSYGGNTKAMKDGYRIGGDTFQNREGLLPSKSGRRYTECDIVAPGVTSRGAKRIVFSNDGLVYYTDDHYGSFTLLYGKP